LIQDIDHFNIHDASHQTAYSASSDDIFDLQDKIFESVLNEKNRLLQDIKEMASMKFGENTDDQKFLMNKAQTLFYHINQKIREKENSLLTTSIKGLPEM
jgi:hypothetical protein